MCMHNGSWCGARASSVLEGPVAFAWGSVVKRRTFILKMIQYQQRESVLYSDRLDTCMHAVLNSLDQILEGEVYWHQIAIYLFCSIVFIVARLFLSQDV